MDGRKGKMTFTILTSHSAAFDELAALTLPTKHAYCDRHGYTLRVRDLSAVVWAERNSQQLEELQNTDWLFFVACDAAVMNPSISLESILSQWPGATFLIARDPYFLNNDVWLARNCPAMVKFFDQVIEDVRSGLAPNDQESMQFRAPMLGGGLRIVPQRTFNSFPYDEPAYQRKQDGYLNSVDNIERLGGPYRAPDFILHASGMDMAGRMELFGRLLK
jgi:hypothetical protein